MILDWYADQERQIKECWHHLRNFSFHSERLVPLINECCALFESVLVHDSGHDLKIGPICAKYGQRMGRKWLVFEPTLTIVWPFQNWKNVSEFTDKTYSDHRYQLDWWAYHNKTKHNRLSCVQEATLEKAINALGAVLIAILSCQFSYGELSHSDYFISKHPNPANGLYDDWNQQSARSNCWRFVKTDLFYFLPEIWKIGINDSDTWPECEGHNRFKRWFREANFQPQQGLPPMSWLNGGGYYIRSS